MLGFLCLEIRNLYILTYIFYVCFIHRLWQWCWRSPQQQRDLTFGWPKIISRKPLLWVYPNYYIFLWMNSVEIVKIDNSCLPFISGLLIIVTVHSNWFYPKWHLITMFVCDNFKKKNGASFLDLEQKTFPRNLTTKNVYFLKNRLNCVK